MKISLDALGQLKDKEALKPDENVCSKEIKEAVESLPKEQRKIVVYIYVHGYTHEECVDKCNIDMQLLLEKEKQALQALARYLAVD